MPAIVHKITTIQRSYQTASLIFSALALLVRQQEWFWPQKSRAPTTSKSSLLWDLV